MSCDPTDVGDGAAPMAQPVAGGHPLCKVGSKLRSPRKAKPPLLGFVRVEHSNPPGNIGEHAETDGGQILRRQRRRPNYIFWVSPWWW
jgi:hypothetical protein